MKIEQFLGKKQRLKYTLMKRLLAAPERRVPMTQLMDELEVSYGTMSNLFEEIVHDIGLNRLSTKMELMQNRLYAQKYYCLQMKDITSLDYLLFHYLNESVQFILLKDVILGQHLTIKEAAERYHLSESTFRRVVNELNKHLIPYNITLSLKSELHLEGNEWGIRLFAAMLLSQSYGSKEWLFQDISMAEVQRYAALIKSQFIYTDNLVNDVSALYLIAISFLRRKNFKKSFIPKDKKNWLYIEDTKEFQEFLKIENQFLVNMKFKLKAGEREVENQVIFTLLLLNNNLDLVQKQPHFFFQLQLKDTPCIFKLGMDLMAEVERELPTTLTMEEQMHVEYQFNLIAYRQLLMEKIYVSRAISTQLEEQGTIQRIFEMISSFFYENSLFLPEYEKLLLKDEYTRILFTQVDWLRYKPILHIYPISGIQRSHFIEILSQATPNRVFNVCIDKQLTEQTDLIVSDGSFIQNLVDSYSSKPVFYWKENISDNSERYYNVLSRISRRKWEEMKHS